MSSIGVLFCQSHLVEPTRILSLLFVVSETSQTKTIIRSHSSIGSLLIARRLDRVFSLCQTLLALIFRSQVSFK